MVNKIENDNQNDNQNNNQNNNKEKCENCKKNIKIKHINLCSKCMISIINGC